MAATKSSPHVNLALRRVKYFWTTTLGLYGFAAASVAEPVIFSAMGCGPYTPADKPAVAFYVARENQEHTSDFMVHLGDVFKMPLVNQLQLF